MWLQAHFAKTPQVKQSVAQGVLKHLSANAHAGCALVHTLRNSATLGSRMCSGSPAMTSGVGSSAARIGVIGASLDVDGPSY